MAIATRTDTTLTPTITQATLVAAIQAAFVNAGYASIYDSFLSGTDNCLVYEFIVDSTKTFGKVYLRIRVSSLTISQQIFTAWNATAHTGTNGSTEATYSNFGSSPSCTLTALNGGSEYKLVMISQTTTLVPLGVIAPANRPGWWDLNSWAYGFYFPGSTLSLLRSVAVAAMPYSSTDFTPSLINNGSMGVVNAQTNKPDIIQGILLLSATSGIAARTSDDLCIGAFSGQTRLAIANPFGTTQQFLIISNSSGGLGVRIA